MKKSYLSTPIYDTLHDYLSRNPVRFHVPFHTGLPNNNVLPREAYNLDVSEVSGYDIEGPDNPVYRSEKITASFFSVEHSFYLTGGASIGLVASIIALNKFGKKVILARNVHKSIINGVILAGLEIVWLEVVFLDEWGIFSRVEPDKLDDLIARNPDIAGCVIVSPSYEGIISDVRSIADICHKKNIPLIVDEAHGAHLYFLEEKGVPISHLSALNSDADLIIQSWHKSLGSLTQSGVLHLANNNFFDYHDIKRSLDLVSSTSPSFLLLLSLELTRKNLAETEDKIFNQLLINAISFRDKLKKNTQLDLLDNEDLFKIYIKSKNISGIDFAYEVYKNYSIEIEMANEIGLLMLVGRNFNDAIMTKTINSIERAMQTLKQNDQEFKVSHKQQAISYQFNSCISLREAFLQGFRNKNDLEYESDIKAPCPPGYALKIPGDLR